jgi:hypothetical protein
MTKMAIPYFGCWTKSGSSISYFAASKNFYSKHKGDGLLYKCSTIFQQFEKAHTKNQSVKIEQKRSILRRRCGHLHSRAILRQSAAAKVAPNGLLVIRSPGSDILLVSSTPCKGRTVSRVPSRSLNVLSPPRNFFHPTKQQGLCWLPLPLLRGIPSSCQSEMPQPCSPRGDKRRIHQGHA